MQVGGGVSTQARMIFEAKVGLGGGGGGGGVVAGQRLVEGITSRSFESAEMTATAKTVDCLQALCIKGYLDVNSRMSTQSWFKCISLAVDVHSANVQLSVSKCIGDKFACHVEVVKNVEMGQELLLWFSEELIAMVDMPFLTPRNIIGHKKYRCHECGDNFEHPNPLKLHLFLACRRESTSTALWSTVAKKINPKLTPSPLMNPSSAFIPYKRHTLLPPPMQPLNLSIGTTNVTTTPWTFNVDEYAADVELFASNWGKSKNGGGHLCVYCGKVYSRKYGLKIHIRTHTGYKPLKCKFCLRPFGDPSNLNKHVRLHDDGVAQYVCTLCGKVLVRRRDLERHLRCQHGGGC